MRKFKFLDTRNVTFTTKLPQSHYPVGELSIKPLNWRVFPALTGLKQSVISKTFVNLLSDVIYVFTSLFHMVSLKKFHACAQPCILILPSKRFGFGSKYCCFFSSFVRTASYNITPDFDQAKIVPHDNYFTNFVPNAVWEQNEQNGKN